MDVELPVPDHSTVSRRKGQLDISLPVVAKQGAIPVVVDGTGIKVYGEGEWKTRQYGISKRRTWRKLHLNIDELTSEILSAVVTGNEVHDREVFFDCGGRVNSRTIKEKRKLKAIHATKPLTFIISRSHVRVMSPAFKSIKPCEGFCITKPSLSLPIDRGQRRLKSLWWGKCRFEKLFTMQTLTVNQVEIPVLGFGTYQLEGDVAARMVPRALELGYRHIDTAQIYENEEAVGEGMKASGVPREEIFLTTKVWVDRFEHDALLASVDESLNRLGTDYVDLLLLHWPNPDVPLTETLAALMQVQDAKKTRLIGVSNFTTALMRRAADICGNQKLAVNQVEYHPFLDQSPVIQEAAVLGMEVTAYRPIAKGKVLEDETLTRIGKQYEKNGAQITLRWLVQQGAIAIPRTSKADHAQQNFDIFDFSLTEQEMADISALRGNQRLVSPESLAPNWD